MLRAGTEITQHFVSSHRGSLLQHVPAQLYYTYNNSTRALTFTTGKQTWTPPPAHTDKHARAPGHTHTRARTYARARLVRVRAMRALTHTQRNHVARTGDRPGTTGARRGNTTVVYCFNKCRLRRRRRFILTPCVVVPADQIAFAHVQGRPVFRRFRVFAFLGLRRSVRGFRVARAVSVLRRVHLHSDGRRVMMHDHNNTIASDTNACARQTVAVSTRREKKKQKTPEF